MKETLRKHLEKLISLTDDEFNAIFSHFAIEHYKKNDFIFQNGKPVKNCYFVLSGLLKLVYHDDLGKEHIVSFSMEDWWESDFYAYFTQTKSTMALISLEETSVYSLPIENYKSLCATIPKMENFFLQKSNLGFIGSQQRILSLLTSNAKERYHILLKQHPSLLQRVSKTQIATYLGVSRETLSRLHSYK
ncbi:Crp/Fnr family transcriptional regulator [uncultured Arcticibacterium sp.]|uniref:Crp/Fnr family transcriptional regulator n=1 Tax=uncultured Arcticibacterium sp. TaxID=2173042 RepID=UPI0030F5150B